MRQSTATRLSEKRLLPRRWPPYQSLVGVPKEVDEPELLVCAHQRPDVGVAGVLPRSVFPGLMTELTGLRYGLGRSQSCFPVSRIEAAYVARRRLWMRRHIRDRRADDHDVSADGDGRAHRVLAPAHFASQPEGQVHGAAVAEVSDRLAAECIDCAQPRVPRRVEESRRQSACAVRPERGTAVREAEVRRRPSA